MKNLFTEEKNRAVVLKYLCTGEMFGEFEIFFRNTF